MLRRVAPLFSWRFGTRTQVRFPSLGETTRPDSVAFGAMNMFKQQLLQNSRLCSQEAGKQTLAPGSQAAPCRFEPVVLVKWETTQPSNHYSKPQSRVNLIFPLCRLRILCSKRFASFVSSGSPLCGGGRGVAGHGYAQRAGDLPRHLRVPHPNVDPGVSWWKMGPLASKPTPSNPQVGG